MSLVSAIAAPQQITAALQQASAKTGTDFNYLLKTAMRESSMNCNAQSGTSSACGLFQFTEQSWLGTMKQDGGNLGLGKYADAITKDSSGRYTVTDPAARREILALRKDPQVSALMAGAYASASKDRLEGSLGRPVSGGELYIAHFLGAGGASKLINSAEDTPNTPADELFPAAASANRSIFYNQNGSPKSVSEVYDNLIAKHRNTTGDSSGATMTASRGTPASNLDAGATDFQSFRAAIGDQDTGDSSPYQASSYNYSSSTSTRSTGAAIHGLGSRSPITLTPDVVQMLASLDVPETTTSSAASQAAQDKRDERDQRNDSDNDNREDSRVMRPRGAQYVG